MSDNDSFTETTSTSWGSRLGSSFGGIGMGIVLFIAATALLYWNEGRAVRTGDAIAEAQLATVPLPSITKVDPAFEGKTVYATGRAVTKDVLTDSDFGVKVNAIGLNRKAEFYQWTQQSKSETKKKLGGGEETVTTYTYSKKWVSSPVDSQSFKSPSGHENTVRVQTDSQKFMADNVTFGAYRLPKFLVKSISGAKPLDISMTEEQRAELQKKLFSRDPNPSAQSAGGPTTMVHTQGNMLYFGRSPNEPRVGDVRLTFTEIPQNDISIIATVSGSTFKQFRASNGNTFSKLSMGEQDMNAMFDAAKSSNSIMTWVLRLAGILLCIGGIRMLVAPLQVLADVVPFIGSIVGLGTSLVSGVIGTAWSLLVIAFSWIRFRPVLGACLLGAALLLCAALILRARARKKQAPARS